MGLGKTRTLYGQFVDKYKIAQEEVREDSGLSRETVSKACSNKGYLPNARTMKSLLDSARRLSGRKEIRSEDFWPM